ncbi:lipase [Streptomyces hygroscopicus subsp. hygroscopicus]|uniref:SGNH/GDSL hydrolase family protein n=1 Tax=Streptomyces sp. KHY 26 TaxID=3097359 RepID=UPI0024A193C3|nr:SGNH/GDSL hydrolase family protein [Streptomyces hygroscopicus]GLX53048.1 lipase [Streptomyces hygroscopicus subsp. hygroscopicus]
MTNDGRTTDGARARRRAAVLAAAVGGCALVAASTAPATAHPAGHGHRLDYVALGDSYTSGPGIPTQVDADCARSDHDYPSLVAQREGASSFTDASCSGATTAQMWQAQGGNPPQLDAVSRDTDLVSVQIGGNDVGFGTIIGTCARLGVQDPTGNPCERAYEASGQDRLALAVRQTAPKIAEVLRAVHARAPHARVVVVGYPDLLPDDGVGCFPQVPFAQGDFAYLRDTEKRLDLMLRTVAARNRAEYVDTYGPTIGHDMCKAPADRWIEPLQPAAPAAPAHPNARGEEAMAQAVVDRLAGDHGHH